MDNDSIDLSVIVPIYERRLIFKQFLEQLKKQTLPGINWELIIVDHGSKKPIVDLVQSAQLSVSWKIIQLSRNSNNCSIPKAAGVEEARGRILCLIDCDILLLKGALFAHYKAVKGREETVSIGYNFYPSAPMISWADTFEQAEQFEYIQQDFRQVYFDGSEKKDLSYGWLFCWMGNVAFSKELYFRTGGFDTSFAKWGCEDTDFAYRMAKNGASFIFNRKAAALHYPHFRPRSNSEEYIQTREYLFQKHSIWEIELLVTGRRKRIEWYKKQKEMIVSQQRKNSILPITIPFFPNIIIGGVSAQSLNAQTVISLDKDLSPTYQLFGFHLPLKDNSMERAVITDFWRFFDASDVRDLICETMRVSKQVYICCREEKDLQSPWFGDIESLETMMGEFIQTKKINKNLYMIFNSTSTTVLQ